MNRTEKCSLIPGSTKDSLEVSDYEWKVNMPTGCESLSTNSGLYCTPADEGMEEEGRGGSQKHLELRDLYSQVVGSHNRESHLQAFIQHFMNITAISAILLAGQKEKRQMTKYLSTNKEKSKQLMTKISWESLGEIRALKEMGCSLWEKPLWRNGVEGFHQGQENLPGFTIVLYVLLRGMRKRIMTQGEQSPTMENHCDLSGWKDK